MICIRAIFFISPDGKVIPFDFDDAEYNFFANDIAVSLYYLLNCKHRQKNKRDFAAYFLEHYLKGYETENHIETEDLHYIPLFLKLRSLLLYIIIREVFDWTKFDEKQLKKRRIHKGYLVQDVDVLDYDWLD